MLDDNPVDPRDPDRFEDSVNFVQAELRNRFIPSNVANEILLDVFMRTQSFEPGLGMPNRLYWAYERQVAKVDSNNDGTISFGEAAILGEFNNGDQVLTGRDLYLSAVDFNRFTVTREINDGLLAPRFAPSQRAYVASGFVRLLDPGIDASIPRDADDR